jgi:hypothetical protein
MNKKNCKSDQHIAPHRPLEIAFYSSPKGAARIEVYYKDESLWLSQKKLAELYGVEVNTINYHLKEIFASGELDETSVIRKIRITANDGKQYLTGLYCLDAIIAIGYRVNSYQASRFRIWATQVLKEYRIKGFVLDDARLKHGLSYYTMRHPDQGNGFHFCPLFSTHQ